MVRQALFPALLAIALALGFTTQAVAADNGNQASSQEGTMQSSNVESSARTNNAQAGNVNNRNGTQSKAGQMDHGQAGSGQKNGQNHEQMAQNQNGPFITAQKSSQVLASSIMGMAIQNGTGDNAQQIGTVNDLIMNKQHQLVGVVVGIGGFLGIGQKDVGIKWQTVQNVNPEKGIAIVTISKKDLQNAPTFTSKQQQKQKKKQQKQQNQDKQHNQQTQQRQSGQQQPATGDNSQ